MRGAGAVDGNIGASIMTSVIPWGPLLELYLLKGARNSILIIQAPALVEAAPFLVLVLARVPVITAAVVVNGAAGGVVIVIASVAFDVLAAS